MSQATFTLNGQQVTVDAPDDMPLLWVLRDRLGLIGTRFGCGIGQCGTCTVLLNGNPIRSCLIPLSSLNDADIVTIEGISAESLHPVQQAWIDEEVSQCGYCQSGQIITAVALLKDKPDPSDTDIDNAMREVLCRCGTYPRIRKAIHRASKLMGNDKDTS